MPARAARSSPAAFARLEMTTAIAASSRPSAMLSMMACRLLPRPEMRTPILRLLTAPPATRRLQA